MGGCEELTDTVSGRIFPQTPNFTKELSQMYLMFTAPHIVLTPQYLISTVNT